jgi:uncharacterized repeat protein (TIGR02543 family)
MSNATIFCEADKAPSEWNERYNTSYRPIFFGCEFSEDNSYVVAFTMYENGFDNVDESNVIATPTREGYTFAGWSTVQDGTAADYTMETIVTAPIGTKLYAIWTK